MEQLAQQLGRLASMYEKYVKTYKCEAIGQDAAARLTLNHFFYLMSIHELQGPTFSELAEKLEVTKPSITAIVNKLIEEGFVEKVQSTQDRRIFHLFLTEKGNSIIQAEYAGSRSFADQVRSCLSSDELDQLTGLLHKVLGKINLDSEMN